LAPVTTMVRPVCSSSCRARHVMPAAYGWSAVSQRADEGRNAE
jgi:hypothetical protein